MFKLFVFILVCHILFVTITGKFYTVNLGLNIAYKIIIHKNKPCLINKVD
jgi:hypothetical protein